MHPKDVPVCGDRDYLWMNLRRAGEVYEQGMDGMSDDFRLLNSDFGFKIEDVRKDLPVHIWHGRLDDMVPLQHAEKVAARLGDNAHLRITDDTHLSVWAEQKEEYLGELVRAIKA
jgi:pimeloyl-ACP methyl ester carboxylesterase